MSAQESNGGATGKGEFPIDDITESDEGLLDSDKEEVKGHQQRETYPDVGELDYDELMENEGNEDEVKVHVSEDIEEGEVTSDEEGEIKESDDEHGPNKGREEPSTATPTQAKPPSNANVTTTTGKADKDVTVAKLSKKQKQTRKENGSSSEEGSTHSSEEKDQESGEGGGRGETRGGDKVVRGSGEGVEKLPTVCRHFLGGKCNWGNNCRFLHEEPAGLMDRQKLPPHDRLGGPMDFHGGPPNGPWGFPRGFPPPHFMPGPMGRPHDLPPHVDPMGGVPLPPHGRGGFRMHPVPPFAGHVHPRDLPPGPPFDPMSPGGMEERRPYPRYRGGGTRGGKNGGKISEVTEETDGWMRLRTVTQDWSSDEEQGDQTEEDLRDKIKSKRGRDSDSDSDENQRPRPHRGADDWTDPWARDLRKDQLGKKKRKKDSSGEESSDDEERARKKAKAKKLSGGRKSRKRSESMEELSESDEKSRKKKKKKKTRKRSSTPQSSSESDSEVEKRKKKQKDGGKKRKKKSRDDVSSDEETKKKRKKSKLARHLGSPSPPADPRRFGDYPYPSHPFPPHPPPDERHRWPPHHSHGAPPFDYPHGSHPPRTTHRSPKKDQFGRDISKRLEYEDSRRPRRGDRHAPPSYHDEYPPPPHRPGQRDLAMWDPRRKPHPFIDGYRRRRSSEDISRSPTPLANLESGSSEEESGRGRRGKGKRSKSSDSEKSMTRREKLLREELEVIDKAIAKKKTKKRSY